MRFVFKISGYIKTVPAVQHIVNGGSKNEGNNKMLNNCGTVNLV